ncbi:predicted protein [Pyrenophora tritici-repentis Pt-1C-BFP]|uniref:Uncharacterized protein n=1 Tax=Pyrenophora tritici-repentis (strain Pt-1C-BFP) TaxID=426418 RepID=B2W0K1_PYRTR|nr:uncharacterized protein PTRG_03986 [Pyrenophora tritici-repentis Pt-1C-BFP]EDU46824.1 predicted protein [Pyrenophora tritici-repentis Pt-1C-BFP]
MRSNGALCGVLAMENWRYPTVFLPLHDNNQGVDWTEASDRPAVVQAVGPILVSEAEDESRERVPYPKCIFGTTTWQADVASKDSLRVPVDNFPADIPGRKRLLS